MNTILDHYTPKILRAHKLYCKEKNIKYEIENDSIHISRENLKRIFNKREKCISHENVLNHSSIFKCEQPKQLVGVNMMEILKKKRILEFNYYIIGFLFAKYVRKKRFKKKLLCIQECYEILNLKL